jgi:hypothetical protein
MSADARSEARKGSDNGRLGDLAKPPKPQRCWRLTRVAAIYFVFFALLFAQFPLTGKLPGNCDTWLNGLALPNLLKNRIASVFTGEPTGTSFYPETGVLGFGESAVGSSLIFVAAKVVTGDDVVAYYLFMVIVFALNALAVYLLAAGRIGGGSAAVVAGLAFSASGYILANIDSPHTSFFFVGLLGVVFLERFFRNGSRRDLFWSASLIGLQVYFSAYVFLFICTLATVLALFRLPRVLKQWRPLALATVLCAVFTMPFFAFYSSTMKSENFVNPWDLVFLAELHSLEPGDLVRTVSGNLLYPFLELPITSADLNAAYQKMVEAGVLQHDTVNRDDATTVFGTVSPPDDVKYFVFTRRCAFLGLGLYALALYGAVVAPLRRRWELVALFVLGFTISLGPVILVGETLFGTAMLPLYMNLDLAGLLRVPCRAFALSTLAVVLLAAEGLAADLQRSRWRNSGTRRAAIGAVAAVLLLENVPFPLPSFEGRAFAEPPAILSEFLEHVDDAVVLNLPSRTGGALRGDSKDLFEWNRELIYMNHQTYHRRDVLNGVHGYFPVTRLEVQRAVDALPSEEAFAALRGFDLGYLVYHHDLELPWEKELFERLNSSPQLIAVDSDEGTSIFRLREAS